jgi:IS4 transposase
MDQCTEVIRTIKSVFPDSHVNAVARETGFVKRLRKINPVLFLWTLVLGFGVGGKRDISTFRRVYERISGMRIVPSAFYDRFRKPLVRFLRCLLRTAIRDMRAAWFDVDDRLRAFSDIVVTDATLVKLHDNLAHVYPGPRTNSSPAAAKLHAVLSVTGKGKSTVRLSSGRVHDQKKFQVGPWVRDRLLMFDLGYYRFQLFSSIERNGGYFLTRLKENANPKIVTVHNSPRGRSDPLVGKHLQHVLGSLRREFLDLDIELQFQKRNYRRQRSRTRQTFRLVAMRNRDTGKYHCYITNVSRELLNEREIVCCYRCRWSVELVFKELKSGYRLDQITSRQPQIVEALLYAAVLTLIVSRRLLALLARLVSTGVERVTAGRWWRLLSDYAQEILLLIVRPRREVNGVARDLIATLVHELVDPHTTRRSLFRSIEGYAGS